ncbi:MAG: UDP-N-acetylmuramate--L-alanine ligase [Deltaproteobacteria bacterium]|jgi:UDP-N-acetylmuramate--alanine ligase|nr:UDP-N-acetylmuramate--L-alanine ligase [Deltaproteobacteria bacterium]
MYGKIQKIHFVGIGGIGMSGIAEVLINLGYQVSGSDLRESEITRRLKDLGGTIAYGHRAENLKDADVVVTSTAVRAENPEVLEAHRKMIPVIPRAEMLAELMRMKYGIAIAGTHGKTTTTSMVAAILSNGGIDPTVVIGGRLDLFESNAKLGQGKFLVAEADESDGSFLKLSPTIAVVTNVDADHLDYYKDLNQIRATFVDFINKIPFFGLAVLCLDDPNIQNLIPQVKKRMVTYGLTTQADFHASDIQHAGERTQFKVHFRGEILGELRFRMPGRHNVLNALAAVAVGMELDLPFETIAEGFKDFGGIQRRFQIKGIINDIMVVDDYGHHPAEIKVTLAAARSGWSRRIIAVFQPHRYSRTKALYEEFLTAFYEADHLVILDIYAAGEDPVSGVSSAGLAAGIVEHGHKSCRFVSGSEMALSHLQEVVKPGDLVLTLGAGNVWQLGEKLLTLLKDSNASIHER